MKKFVIYDSRYYCEADRVMVLATCNTLEEAEEEQDNYGSDTVIVEEEIG